MRQVQAFLFQNLGCASDRPNSTVSFSKLSYPFAHLWYTIGFKVVRHRPRFRSYLQMLRIVNQRRNSILLPPSFGDFSTEMLEKTIENVSRPQMRGIRTVEAAFRVLLKEFLEIRRFPTCSHLDDLAAWFQTTSWMVIAPHSCSIFSTNLLTSSKV